MLAAGSAGESRSQILNALKFESVFDNEDDLNAIDAPFEAYHELISRLQKQPAEGYTLDIGKLEKNRKMGRKYRIKLFTNYF